MTRPRHLFGAMAPLAVAILASACSWQRYDDITNNPPVRLLDAPAQISGMGTSLATYRDSNNAIIALATALDGYTVFDLSHSANDAIAEETCERSDGCFIAEQAATIYRNIDGAETPCVAHAFTLDSSNAPRLRLYCEGGVKSLTLPAATLTQLGTPSKATTLGLSFASSPRKAPKRLLASVPKARSVVYFPTTSGPGVPVAVPSGATESFGRATALLDSRFDTNAAGATLVIGEPDVSRVHLYAVDEAGTVVASACLSGSSDFGSLLATGYFASTNSEGLAIGTSSQLTVLPDLSQLGALAVATAGCIDANQLSAAQTLDCRGLELGSSCSSELSTGSLAAADLDGDGLDELLVGAPTVAASGKRFAGVVVTLKFTPALVVFDHLSPSSAESGDRFGQSVIGVPLSGRDVVLAGAPGGNKLAAFYCSSLVPDGVGGKRCQ